MKIKTLALIEDLITRTEQNIREAGRLKDESVTALNWKISPTEWSVLECIAHLNLYGDFYLPEIRNRMTSSQYPASESFKSGWLGNYFANSMLPKKNLNKMKTFKSMNTAGSVLGKDTLDKFIAQQNEMLALLNQSKAKDLSRTRTGISIANWIKLRLGDTFRVVIYHNDRHIVQAKAVLSRMKMSGV